jgi:hypothetical protein
LGQGTTMSFSLPLNANLPAAAPVTSSDALPTENISRTAA